MAEKALYLIARFDVETQSTFSGYYHRLQEQGFIGKQTKDIPYHFTLGSYEPRYENELIDEMEQVCKRANVINIRLDHIGLFGLNVLFIEPNMNFELLTLQKSFLRGDSHGEFPWTAHTTILMDEPDEILRALPIVADYFKPFYAKIESVGLYEFFPERFIKECPLNVPD